MPTLLAASIFAFNPPTGPIKPPELIVPVIAVFSSRLTSSINENVKRVIAAPALGPAIIGLSAVIV